MNRSITIILLFLIFVVSIVTFYQYQKRALENDVNAKQEKWITLLRSRFGNQADQARYLYLVPKKIPFGLSRHPFMILPVGAWRFNELPVLAFFPGDGAQDEGQQNAKENENHEDDAPPVEDDADEMSTNNNDNADDNDSDPTESDVDEADDWPETEEELEDMIEEDEINEALDKALREAFPDDQDSDSEPENGDTDPDRTRIRLRYGIPPPWYPFGDVPLPFDDEPRLDPDFDFPRWDDLKIPDDGPPPGWLGEWPPRQFGLPDELKPRDDGFNLGGWRLYFGPQLDLSDP